MPTREGQAYHWFSPNPNLLFRILGFSDLNRSGFFILSPIKRYFKL